MTTRSVSNLHNTREPLVRELRPTQHLITGFTEIISLLRSICSRFQHCITNWLLLNTLLFELSLIESFNHVLHVVFNALHVVDNKEWTIFSFSLYFHINTVQYYYIQFNVIN